MLLETMKVPKTISNLIIFVCLTTSVYQNAFELYLLGGLVLAISWGPGQRGPGAYDRKPPFGGVRGLKRNEMLRGKVATNAFTLE